MLKLMCYQPVLINAYQGGLSVLGALGKLIYGAPKVLMQKLSPIIQQFKCNINTLLCMHACIYNISIVYKKACYTTATVYILIGAVVI